jgi:hypothetical protein
VALGVALLAGVCDFKQCKRREQHLSFFFAKEREELNPVAALSINGENSTGSGLSTKAVFVHQLEQTRRRLELVPEQLATHMEVALCHGFAAMEKSTLPLDSTALRTGTLRVAP